MSTIREAIEHWQKEHITGTALMRAMVSHKQWMIPVSAAAAGRLFQNPELDAVMINQGEDGTRKLYVFSDPAAYLTFEEAAGVRKHQDFVTMEGKWLFRQPWEGISVIAINPTAPPEIFYSDDQFPRLSQIADCVELEETLERVCSQEKPPAEALAIVRDYSWYMVAIREVGGRRRIATTESNGRKLACVFTLSDAFDAFVDEWRPRGDNADWQPMDCERGTVFAELLNVCPDGVVVNCCGPSGRHELSRGLVERLTFSS